MVSSAAALSNLGRKFVYRDSEQRYVRRVTMTSRDAIPSGDSATDFDYKDYKPEWLKESATRLVEFTRLPHDWDLEGGDPVDPHAARVAFIVLAGLAARVNAAPDLVPVGDGGVMVEWHTPTADLEIEIGPDFEGSVYFRDRRGDRQFHSTRLGPLLGSLSRFGSWIDSSD